MWVEMALYGVYKARYGSTRHVHIEEMFISSCDCDGDDGDDNGEHNLKDGYTE